MKSAEELLADIDATLEQLMRNTSALQEVRLEDLSDQEISAFHKTQESLVARLVHRREEVSSFSHKKMQEKIHAFHRLNLHFVKAMKQSYVQRPRIHRNRKKVEIFKT